MRSALALPIAVLLVSSLLPMAIVTAATTADPALSGDGSNVPSPVTDSTTNYAASQPDSDETTRRLGLDGATEAAYTTTGPDLGTTLAAADDEIRQEWTIQRLEHEWSDLSDREREDRLEVAERRLNERLDALDAREQAVVRRMAGGEASGDRVLRTLARNDHEAAVLARNLNRLSALADDVPDYSLVTRSTMGAVSTHEGFVRDRVFQTSSASDPTSRTGVTLVESSDSGVVVSTAIGNTYLREATRYDHRDPSLPSQLSDLSSGNERITELYPWAHSDGLSDSNSLDQYLSIQQFRVETHHDHGLLRAHLDSGTTEIFRENQELRIDDLPVESAGTWNGEATTVSLNVTPRNGPIQFNVTDTSGQPVPATILVDGQPVGETGSDGTAWVVRSMDGAEFTVQTDAESITVDPAR